MTILGRGLLGQPLTDESLLIGNSGILDELPVGTLNQVLTVTAGGVDWETPTSGTLTSIATGIALTGGPITTTGTIDLDMPSLPSLVGVATADELLIYDISSSTHQRVTVAELDLAIGPTYLDDLADVTVGNPPGAGQDGYVVTWNNTAGEFQLIASAAGTVTDAFTTITADSGTDPVADSSTDTLIIAGGEIIATVGDGSSDTVTIELDINSATSTTPVGTDEMVIYDISAAAHRKITLNDLSIIAGGGEANTASNAGSGVDVFDQKIGVDLVFNTILGASGVESTLNGNTIELDLDFTTLPLLTTGISDDDYIALYENGAAGHFRVPLSDLPFLLPSNNLSDVDNSQTSIDNLTKPNIVSVAALQFEEKGASDGMKWFLEEDSSGGTESLTFDYGGVERIRFTSSGGARFDGIVEINGASAGQLKISGGADIIDDNDNTILSFNEVASAVNWIDIQNAATGTRPEITTLGTDTSGSGLGLDITARNASTSGDGGRLRFVTGNGFSTGNGGLLSLTTGTGGAVAGDGGDVTITSGSSLGGADGDGGDITLSAGSNLGGVGDVGDGGSLTFTAGNSVDGDGGSIAITAGQGADASTVSNAGGDVTIKAGAGVSGASNGYILLQNTSSTTLVRVGDEEISLLPHGVSSGDTTELRFLELASNGINYVGVKAPNSIASNIIWTLPSADGTVGQLLSTNGSGVLSWATASGSGTVTSVATGVGLTGGPITTSGTINLDIDGLTLETTLGSADTIAFYDDSAGAHRKTTLSDLSTFVGAASSLNQLTDVTVPTPVVADYLRYSSGMWRNEQLTIVDDLIPQLGGNLDVNGFDIVSTSNGDIFITPDGAGTIVLDGLIWPTSDGTSGQVLTTDGSGNLSFTSATGLQNVVEDLTPQLGGDLDVNGQSIISLASEDIPITPGAGGNIILDGLFWPSTDGTSGQVLVTDGSGNLSFTTVAGTGTVTSIDVSAGPGGGFFTAGGPVTTAGTILVDYDWSSLPAAATIALGDLMITATGTGTPTTHVKRPVGDLGVPGGGFLLTAVVDDTTPQLGGDLDANSFNVGFDDGTGITDEAGNEQLVFNETPSAVNSFEMTNAATGDGPTLSVEGGDSDIDLVVFPKGVGRFEVGGIFYSKRQTLTIVDATTDSAFFTYTAALNEATFIDYGLVRSGDGSRAGTLTIITDGTSVSIADTGTDISSPGVTFTAIVSGADIIVRYTSTSTGNGGTMAYSIRQWDV